MFSQIVIFWYKSVAHCETPIYDVGIQTYDQLSGIYIKEKASNGTNTSKNDTATNNSEPVLYRYLSFYYGTTDVKASTTSLKIDFNTFISNVGGNLGLFVGVDILGGLFFIYDFIASRMWITRVSTNQ